MRQVVLGAGGFIGSHLVKRLVAEGRGTVVGVDRRVPRFGPSAADDFIIGDLRNAIFVYDVLRGADRIYQLAAQMGGAGYIFTGDHDADLLQTSTRINLNVLQAAIDAGRRRPGQPRPTVFFASSACVYPVENQQDPRAPNCAESTAYPAHPDSEYGWEKLYAERCYLAYARNYGLGVRIARFHSIVGPEGTWTGGKEKVFAATCRKVAEAEDGGEIAIWGDGEQTRTFLYIDDCLDAIQALMASAYTGPFNVGSTELVSINALVAGIAAFAGKRITIRHETGPLGVRGRASHNTRIVEALGWTPTYALADAIAATYPWIARQVTEARAQTARI